MQDPKRKLGTEPEWRGLFTPVPQPPMELPMVASIALSTVTLLADWSTSAKLVAAGLALVLAVWALVLWQLDTRPDPTEETS